MSDKNDDGSAARVLRDKRGLVDRVRRLRGQVDAIERAIAGEASCSDLLQRITAARGAINGLMAEVLEEHVRAIFIAGRRRCRSAQSRCRRGADRNHSLLSHLKLYLSVRPPLRVICHWGVAARSSRGLCQHTWPPAMAPAADWFGETFGIGSLHPGRAEGAMPRFIPRPTLMAPLWKLSLFRPWSSASPRSATRRKSSP